MSPIEAVSPWISSPVPLARSPRPLGDLLPTLRPMDPAAGRHDSAGHAARMRVGVFSLRQIVDAAVAQAEGDAIRRALSATHGNKSRAARLLRTNYTTLHAKMKRYGIPAREPQR